MDVVGQESPGLVVVGAKNSMRLRALRIFVDHSAESIASCDLDLGVVRLGERS